LQAIAADPPAEKLRHKGVAMINRQNCRANTDSHNSRVHFANDAD
jgi:hypothetical protein